jgi:DNA polymerase III alpha subunit
MKIVSARSLGLQPVYDLSVDHDDHSFIHESGVIAHNCAFVIANRPIEEFIPLTTVSDVRVTSYTAPSVEAVGGLKMDFLVVNSLNDIGDCIKLIQEWAADGGRGELIEETTLNGKRVPKHRIVPMFDDESCSFYDIWDLPEDQDVFADVATGKTETVFQFNTPGAQKWLEYFKHRKPDGDYAISSIEDMAAFTALDRPGPLDMSVRKHGYTGPLSPTEQRTGGEAVYRPDGTHNMLVEYANRARGFERSADIMAVFNDMLPETHGVMVYQEQLQKMYQKLTGCTGPEAEDFRKNVAKKKKAKIDQAYPFFMEKATAKIGEVGAKAAWEFFLTWAKYGFNKSHAVCYSVIGYACAYLKHHYPLQWWTAVLRNAKKEEIGEKFWRYCGSMIDLPDVKLSGDNFEIREGRIRAPVSLLQGVGATANEQLKKYAPYADIDDFCKKIYAHQVATGTWENKTKIKKERRVNPETGKKESVPIEVPVRVLKKGYNSLNRGVVQALILGGAMDSLFPPEMHLGEQLNAFEDSLSAATVTKRKPVDQKLWDVGQLQRYQMRKEVLPVYGQDLVPLVESEHFESDPDGNLFYKWTPTNSKSGREVYLRIANAKILERAVTEFQGEGERTQFAVATYVQEQEIRPYQGGAKAFAKLKLNIDGALFEVCAWPSGESKKPDPIYYNDLKGSVIIAVLNRYGKKAEFSLSDIKVVQMPLSAQKEEEKEDVEAANVG